MYAYQIVIQVKVWNRPFSLSVFFYSGQLKIVVIHYNIKPRLKRPDVFNQLRSMKKRNKTEEKQILKTFKKSNIRHK